MTSALKYLIAIAGILLLANCAPAAHDYTIYTTPQTNGLDPSKLVVSPGVSPRGAYRADSVPVETVPYAIDFGSYQYRLDLVKFSISYSSNRQIIRDLTDSEISELKSIMSGAVIASTGTENPNGCSQTQVTAYASLETDDGLFDLGYGSSPCSIVDLYTTSGQLTGLQGFLSGLVSQ